MTTNKTIKKSVIDVGYVAQLARLELEPLSMSKYQKDMENIINYIDLLGELDLENVEPTAHPVTSNNVWREDVAEESFLQDIMLENAPAVVDDKLIRVPQVIAKGN
jgi:aspartyl-tRNA(Asn)/glutamyl-tRNA(Gln) amidotransferase subunit C